MSRVVQVYLSNSKNRTGLVCSKVESTLGSDFRTVRRVLRKCNGMDSEVDKLKTSSLPMEVHVEMNSDQKSGSILYASPVLVSGLTLNMRADGTSGASLMAATEAS